MTDIDAFYRAPGRLSARALGERLQAALALERVQAGRVTRTWYDTFDWRLYAAGRVLEHDRDDGRGRVHLRPLGATTALAAAPAGTVPRFAHELPAGSLHECLAPLVKMRALLPLGSCTLRSITLEGKDAAGKTHVRLVLETPARGERAPPGVLVRLEALRGYEEEAAAVARQLGEHGLAALARDPLDAVLARAGRRPLDYSARPAIELSAALPAAAATARVLAAYLQVMRANEPGICEDIDTECLHDLRTAMRRARSVLQGMREVAAARYRTRFKKQFAWLNARTGPLRDLDVFTLALPRHLQRLPRERRADGERVGAYLARRRRQEHRAVVRCLQGARYARFMQAWSGYLEALAAGRRGGPAAPAPVAAVAAAAQQRLLERVLAQGRDIDADSPVAELHELRKTCKKLRYLLEAFSSLHDATDVSAAVATLKRLQDNLGRICDLYVQRGLLEGWRQQMQQDPRATPGMVEAMLAIEARLDADALRPRRKFAAAFARFTRPGSLRHLARLNRS